MALDSRMYPNSRNSGGNPVVVKERRYRQTLTPAEVATAVCAEQDFTVTGVKAGDVVVGFQNPDLGNATGVAGIRVKADDTIAINFVNPTAGALTPDPGVWDILVRTYK